MEYAVVELQDKTTESTPQQLVAGYDVIEHSDDDVKKPANKEVSIMICICVTVEQKHYRLGFLLSTSLKPQGMISCLLLQHLLFCLSLSLVPLSTRH